MDSKSVIQIEYIDSEKILSEFREIKEQLNMLKKNIKFSGKENTQKPYYTRKEVKEMLGVSYPTLNSWAKKGILTPCKTGRRVLYKAEDLENSLVPMQDI